MHRATIRSGRHVDGKLIRLRTRSSRVHADCVSAGRWNVVIRILDDRVWAVFDFVLISRHKWDSAHLNLPEEAVYHKFFRSSTEISFRLFYVKFRNTQLQTCWRYRNDVAFVNCVKLSKSNAPHATVTIAGPIDDEFEVGYTYQILGHSKSSRP